jgi:hypothetical protein
VDGTRSLSGLLGSAILGIPVSQYFVPYVGGGLGIKLGDDKFFAWKVDGGVASWLSDILYVKTSVSYDNVRKGLGISVGVGFKFEKNVPAVYRNSDGSTFQRYFSKYLWENNSTPNYVYEDKLVSSEVVKTYQTTQTSTQYIAPRYETRVSGGETVTTEIRENRLGGASWTATTTTPKKVETVQTRDSENRINYYVYNVTVTRKWYTRTFYYKDRAPTTQQIYQDSESAVLVNQFSETM